METDQCHASTSNQIKTEKCENPNVNLGLVEEKVFQCFICGLNEQYHYFGVKPPFVRPVKFFEKTYVMKDPFAPYGQGLFIPLGSHCALCEKTVCQAQDCSIYYSKRFCMHCAHNNIAEFPFQVAKEIKKPEQL